MTKHTALIAPNHQRLVALPHDRRAVVRSVSRAVAGLSMDSMGREALIRREAAGDGLLATITRLLASNDAETAQCASLILGNLVT
jgi:hypothetical protein